MQGKTLEIVLEDTAVGFSRQNACGWRNDPQVSGLEDGSGLTSKDANCLVQAAWDGCFGAMGFASWRSLFVLSKFCRVALNSGMNAGSILTPCFFSRCADNSAAEASPISARALRKSSIGFIGILQVVRWNLGCIGRWAGRSSIRKIWRGACRMGGWFRASSTVIKTGPLHSPVSPSRRDKTDSPRRWENPRPLRVGSPYCPRSSPRT
jgi:hypothetical protein